MNHFISEKYILRYLGLTLVFIVVFYSITCYYAHPDGPTPSPIDSRAMSPYNFFDSHYVIDAKASGYNIPHYYQSFFIVDLLFPLVYTLLHLSVLQLIRDKKIYPLLKFFAFACCFFDYLENFSFAIFLQLKGDQLAMFVAGTTTIKSVIVAINLFAAAVIAIPLIYKRFRKLFFNTKM